MVEKVRTLWEKHESSPVPAGFRGIIVDGLTLTQIHCDIAANILTFINTGGHLGSHRVNSLTSSQSKLAKSLETLPQESKAYLANLKSIGDIVLGQLR